MNKNTMYILVAVLIIVIVIAGVVIYMYVGTGGGGGGGGETPATVYTMGNATSLEYTVNLTTASAEPGIYMFAGKGLGTADIWLRVDANPDVSVGTTYSTIMYAGNQTSWTNATGTWEVSDFATDWGTTWSPSWSSYIDHNASWMTGDGDISYSDSSGNDILIYNIVINPTLSDSLFTPS